MRSHDLSAEALDLQSRLKVGHVLKHENEPAADELIAAGLAVAMAGNVQLTEAGRVYPTLIEPSTPPDRPGSA